MTLVDRLIELQQLYDEYIHDMGKFITDKEIIELETIKKQLEENEKIVERLKYDEMEDLEGCHT